MANSKAYVYNVEKLIGKGTFGKIYRATRASATGRESLVAIKEIDLTKCTPKDHTHALREAEVLQSCQHENLVQYSESFTEGRYLKIVMELCNRGNLRTLIIDEKGLCEKQFVDIMSQIIQGLKYLHNKNIIHRDVKTTNILLHEQNGKLLVKIGDFGLAKVMDMSSPTLYVGSPYFMSPEMINGKEYDMKTDIWSLGCCAYEMATTRIPYEANTLESLTRRKTEKKVDSSKIPYCDQMKDLITAMTDTEPTRRPNVEEILSFLKQHDPDTHKTKTQIDNGRRREHMLSVSSPAVLSTRKHDTSGYDTNEDIEGKDEFSIVRVPVRMTKEEEDWFAKANQLQKDITQKLKDKRIVQKMNEAIYRTKHMDDERQFLAEMEKVLDGAMFRKCRPDLMALWGYKTELLKKTFQIAI